VLATCARERGTKAVVQGTARIKQRRDQQQRAVTEVLGVFGVGAACCCFLRTAHVTAILVPHVRSKPPVGLASCTGDDSESTTLAWPRLPGHGDHARNFRHGPVGAPDQVGTAAESMAVAALIAFAVMGTPR
jgi:hypothetical protein